MDDELRDRLLDQALTRLARSPAIGPAPGFASRVMERLRSEEAGELRAFARLLSASPRLRHECAAIGSKTELVAWLARTAQHHQLAARPLLTGVDRYFVSANDGELDDRALDAVVGAGTPGAGYLEGLLRTLPDPQ